MRDHEMERRRVWALTLVDNLIKANESLESLSGEAALQSDAVVDAVRQEGEEKLRSRQEQHASQIQALKDGLANMTAIMNAFHGFREDPHAQQRWSYPFLLMRKGREANQLLRQERERMSTIVLQHRLLEEEIRRLSDSVQRDAASRFGQSEAQTAWKSALDARQRLMDDLCLLLAAIPETARCELDPANPSALAAVLEA
jgi:hypothetical protein